MVCKCLLISLFAGIVVLSSFDAKAIARERKCPKPNEEYASTSVTFYPDLEDCSKFFVCDNGRLVQFDCPSSLLFNPSLNVRKYSLC